MVVDSVKFKRIAFFFHMVVFPLASGVFFSAFPQGRDAVPQNTSGAVHVAARSTDGKNDFELRCGDLKLVLHKETGSFSFYKAAEIGKDKYEPVLDTRNYGAGTRFSVSTGGKTYVLEKKPFRTVGFEVGDGGRTATFVFTPSDDFQVRQKFSFSDTLFDGAAGAFLIIETSVENTSGSEREFSVKALFDTMLGEGGSLSRPEHFTTDDGRKIVAETLLTPRSGGSRFLFSSNGRRSCSFVLGGGGVDVPDAVYIANWYRCADALSAGTDISAGCVEGRSFSTVHAPGDSAVLFGWRTKTLAHRRSFSVKTAVSALDSAPVFPSSGASGGSETSEAGAQTDGEGNSVPHLESPEFYSGLSFEEKRRLYLRTSEKLREAELGTSQLTPSEIDDLHRILDILLDGE